MKDADLKHLKVLYQELVDLREDIILQGNEIISRWSENVENQDTLYSIQNLAYYMAFRKNDLRALQSKLQRYGLSSLGRLESRVIENLDTILVSIANILASDTSFKYPSKESFYRGQQILEKIPIASSVRNPPIAIHVSWLPSPHKLQPTNISSIP